MAVSDQPPDPLTEEVRVAMALNGGVSLAVWMGGCAVEFDCARRAHLGVERSAADKGAPNGHLYNAFARELVIEPDARTLNATDRLRRHDLLGGLTTNTRPA